MNPAVTLWRITVSCFQEGSGRLSRKGSQEASRRFLLTKGEIMIIFRSLARFSRYLVPGRKG
jgi:hypothetical protein